MGTNGAQLLIGSPGTWAPLPHHDSVEGPCCVWQQAQGCPASPHVPKPWGRGVPSAQGCPEGRLGSSSMPSAREGVMPMAQGASHQGTEGHCTFVLCSNCHITRAQPRWTPPKFTLFSFRSPSWGQDLVEESRKGSTYICSVEPFFQAGGEDPRDPVAHTWGPCSSSTPCRGQALGLRVLPEREPCQPPPADFCYLPWHSGHPMCCQQSPAGNSTPPVFPSIQTRRPILPGFIVLDVGLLEMSLAFQ